MSCRRCNGPRLPRRESGAALVIALMVFGICAALIVAMKSDFELFYQRGSNSFLAEQSYTFLRAAEDLASLALVADHDIDETREQQRDDLEEIWAQGVLPYPVEDTGALMRGLKPDPKEGGKFVYLEDLQGRFNLNNLNGGQQSGGEGGEGDEGGAVQKYTRYQAQFIRLLQSFEEPALSQQEAIAVLESVLDWMDPGSVPRMYGAEDDYYYGQTPAYRAANRPFASVTELRAVARMTPELYAQLAPLVTVWPEDGGTLNIHTAPAGVLRALNADDDLTPLDAALVDSLVERRREAPFADKAAFVDQLALGERPTADLVATLGESSSWFLLSALVEVADRETRLYSVLHRSQRHIEAVARSTGEL